MPVRSAKETGRIRRSVRPTNEFSTAVTSQLPKPNRSITLIGKIKKLIEVDKWPLIVGFSNTSRSTNTGQRVDLFGDRIQVNRRGRGCRRGFEVAAQDVDGRRVKVTAQDEIVLQCGSASVTLRRNGRVVIRGAYVETHAEGTNRIKGGQVQIN